MNSLYKRCDYKKRSAQQKTLNFATENWKSVTNKKLENIVLKGVDPNNIHISGNKLIEQAFSQ